ncbi:MAG: protease complex subunit PrcB family protein [Pseudothermotoga sp.]
MRTFVLLLLLVGVSVLAGMIYFTPVEFSFPENLYQAVGSKSANFQYLVLSKSPQIVLLLKGWLFSPVQMGEDQAFKVKILGPDMDCEIEIPSKKSGIYTRMVQHLLILPKETTEISVGGYAITLADPAYTVKTTRGDESVSLILLNENGVPTTAFKVGEKVFLRISAGMKKTGGYQVVVDSVSLLGKVLQIRAHLVSPSPTTPVTQAITYPAVLVQIDQVFEPGKYQVICTLLDVDEKYLSAEFEVY